MGEHDAARKVSKSLDVDVLAYRAGTEMDRELNCGTGEWKSAAGISSTGALLVRPDGFVAWRAYSEPKDLSLKLDEVMRQALCRR